MGAGWIVSLIVVGVMAIVILAISIPMDRKHVVRENGKVNYKKTKIYLRWNVFDTLTLSLSIYAIICVQALNLLVSNGQSVENVYVQFFTNQAQVWTLLSILYLISRVTITLKAIKAILGEDLV
ncbi:group-specific protein [Jeotgalibacillus campisalis]|uniref:Putative lipoprotein n=1 Tax=Jeotgalibacillus campisalis TaxID=220754 RepID=A0A0C2RLK5_9BACL|nr:group-specific protein [Jeotgalibacillus campisalis]KIL51125.1 putative lipoprotein [Jeotgalibacillus campisalis]